MSFRTGVTSYKPNSNGDFEIPINYDANLQRIENKLKQNKVMIFGWSWCPFRKKAKTLLEDAGVEYEYFKIDRQADNVNL